MTAISDAMPSAEVKSEKIELECCVSFFPKLPHGIQEMQELIR
jgi:hypothetical protein